MAEDSKKVSELELLSSLTGTEFVEVVARTPEGTLKNFRVLSDKFRVGKSAYDAAVENGFTGTEAEWLASMNGKSAYQVAVDNGYEGTEEQWVDTLKPLFELLPENVGLVLTADELGLPVWRQIDLSFVNLDRVDNTSDEEKPVSRAQQQALNRKLDANKITSEVMKVLVSVGGKIDEDGQTFAFDEGRADTASLSLKHKRGSTAESETWIGAEGTFFIDLELKRLYVHDGATPGGNRVTGLTEEEVKTLIDADIVMDKVEGLVDALQAKADLGEDGKVLPAQLPDFPQKAETITVLTGTDDNSYITTVGLYALLENIGFARDDGGAWTLRSSVIVEAPSE